MFGIPSSAIEIVLPLRSQCGRFFCLKVEACDEGSALAFQLFSSVHATVVACPRKRTLLSERLLFLLHYGRSRLYILLGTSEKGYQLPFRVQGCEIEA